jgi:hypothetical protein
MGMVENSTPQPEIPQWLIQEAHGDPELLELLQEREWLFEAANPDKDHDKDEIQASMLIIQEGISARKKALGIDNDPEA